MEAKACDVHVFRTHGNFQQLQDAHALPYTVGPNPSCLAGGVNLFKPFVSEATYHT